VAEVFCLAQANTSKVKRKDSNGKKLNFSYILLLIHYSFYNFSSAPQYSFVFSFVYYSKYTIYFKMLRFSYTYDLFCDLKLRGSIKVSLLHTIFQ